MDNHEEGELWEVKLPDQSHTAGKWHNQGWTPKASGTESS